MVASSSALEPPSTRMYPEEYLKWSTTKGRSAFKHSRIGLPLSQVSAKDKDAKLASIRSAIFNRMLERSVTEVLHQLSFALCAASKAGSMSAALERGISQIASPVTGVVLVKYRFFNRSYPLTTDEIFIPGVKINNGAY